MKNQILEASSDAAAIASLTISFQNLESILSIVFICLSIIILLINFALRMHDRLKDGKLSNDELKDTEEDLKKLLDEIKKEVEK